MSVSKTYIHRDKNINHREKTKKYWNIFYYEYDEINEEYVTYFVQVNWFTELYYKFHKYKKIILHCPSCNIDYMHFIKKRTPKHILNEECPTCFMKYKDIIEEIENS